MNRDVSSGKLKMLDCSGHSCHYCSDTMPAIAILWNMFLDTFRDGIPFCPVIERKSPSTLGCLLREQATGSAETIDNKQQQATKEDYCHENQNK